MSQLNFLKQPGPPLFPDVLWQRPVSRGAAGRLLLIGGHRGDFSQIQAIYQTALAAGVGECRVVLPDSLKPLLAGTADSWFVPSSPSGSLGPGALGEILHLSEDYDAIAIGSNLSENSQTSILIESLLGKLSRPAILFGDGLAAMTHNYSLAVNRADRLIIATMPQLFKLAGGLGVPLQIRGDEGVISKISVIEQIKPSCPPDLLLSGRDMVAASKEKISLTSAVSAMDFFATATIGVTSVFWLQQPTDHFAGLTTAAYVLREIRQKLNTGQDQALTTTEITLAIKQALREQTD